MSRNAFDPFLEIPQKAINSYDIDGVIYMGENIHGVKPGAEDIIITGRSKDDREETEQMLLSRGITNPLYMNNKSRDFNDRRQSGQHKAMTLFYLEQIGYRFNCHFEDDPIQIQAIKEMMPHINIVHLDHDLIDKGERSDATTGTKSNLKVVPSY
jgi:hypothetical protein